MLKDIIGAVRNQYHHISVHPVNPGLLMTSCFVADKI
jgi:hypothetical protein